MDHPDAWLAIVFAGMMAISMLLYAVLDGFDLGVGLLLRRGDEAQRDRMIASIGPFWDANETWLVLGVGVLLVAFPKAHGVILSALYLPVALMLAGLILRGVAFDFRTKAPVEQKGHWDVAFQVGSGVASLAQGWMLGSYILGFREGWAETLFCAAIAVSVAAGYVAIGACWLVYKTEGDLQALALGWARTGLRAAAVGVVLVSAATPLVSPAVFERWFRFPDLFALAPVPIATALLFVLADRRLASGPRETVAGDGVPFLAVSGIVVLCFLGLAYSFWPWIVPGRLTIFEAASAPESLVIILVGAAVVLPMILVYTWFVHRVFWGKATDLRYD